MSFGCRHCGSTLAGDPATYIVHAKACLSSRIEAWDQKTYERRYFEQVRAISRYARPGSPRRRSLYRAWGRAILLRAGGPPLVSAEFPVGRDSLSMSYEMEDVL